MEHAGVGAGGGEQLGVGAVLDEATVIHDQDAVGAAGQAEAVGDDDGSLATG